VVLKVDKLHSSMLSYSQAMIKQGKSKLRRSIDTVTLPRRGKSKYCFGEKKWVVGIKGMHTG
jgi:hypothetical protein